MDISKCNRVVKDDGEIISSSSRVPYYPLVIKRGHGVMIEDIDGNEYIDLLSSAAAINVGHSHPKIVKAIIEQVKEITHYTPAYMYHESLVKLGKKLIEITPGNFEKKVTFGLSGSDSIDGMIKFARAYTKRSKIISFIQSYHGSTYGAISLSALSLNMRKKIGPLLPEIHHIQYPDCYRCRFGKEKGKCKLECINELEIAFEHFIPAEEVAAIVMEPIAGDMGLIIPPKEYMNKLHDICKKNGILFVSDEIQQGFGRSGKWFGIDHFNIEPDIIVIGKSVASGMPLSAIIARKEIMESLESPAHLFTIAGNPVSCRAALATIDVIENENLIENANKVGAFTKKRFRELAEKYDIIGDVRGEGLSIGIDLVTDRKTKEKATDAAAKICYRCWEKGILLIFFGKSVLRIQPPLIISIEEMDRAINIIEESIIEYINGKISDEVLGIVRGW